MTTTIAKAKPIIFTGHSVPAILAGRKTMTRRVVKGISGKGELDPDFSDDFPKAGLDRVYFEDGQAVFEYQTRVADTRKHRVNCPYGKPGDRLYVKEVHSLYKATSTPATSDATYCCFPDGSQSFKKGGYYHWDKPVTGKYPTGHRWRSPLFMPRWASRLTLEITEVRVERLTAITEEDAIAEGLEVQIGGGTGPGPGFKWVGHGYWDGYSTHSVHGGKTYHAPRATGLCYCRVGERESLTPAVCAYRHLWDKINGKKPGCSWESDPFVWALTFRRLEERERERETRTADVREASHRRRQGDPSGVQRLPRRQKSLPVRRQGTRQGLARGVGAS